MYRWFDHSYQLSLLATHLRCCGGLVPTIQVFDSFRVLDLHARHEVGNDESAFVSFGISDTFCQSLPALESSDRLRNLQCNIAFHEAKSGQGYTSWK